MTGIDTVVILAGGLATRMRPITETIPKAMIEVAGEPFVAHQLRLLRREGIRRVVLCLGYLGHMVETFVGDGEQFGLEVAVSYDGDRLLGTGGAIRKTLARLGEAFFILYGDSYLDIAYAPIADHFAASGLDGLMTVIRNDDQWDTSNVVFEDQRILLYSKKDRRPEMRHIDYGLGILKASALAGYEEGAAFDLADVYTGLVARQKLAGYEVGQRFYEIGSPSGLEETTDYILRTRDA